MAIGEGSPTRHFHAGFFPPHLQVQATWVVILLVMNLWVWLFTYEAFAGILAGLGSIACV
jgi:hypothetical protein